MNLSLQEMAIQCVSVHVNFNLFLRFTHAEYEEGLKV